MGRGYKALRALFGAVVFVGVVWVLLVGILANHATKTTKTVVTVPSTESFNHWRFTGKGRRFSHQGLNFDYVSKRRVPNGPDPIHNRRAAKSGQPPGRA